MMDILFEKKVPATAFSPACTYLIVAAGNRFLVVADLVCGRDAAPRRFEVASGTGLLETACYLTIPTPLGVSGVEEVCAAVREYRRRRGVEE